MNTNFGLIGKKLGNTQVFEEDGTVTRVTAVQVGPCVILDKRTPEKHGYSALVLGFGEKKAKQVNKPDGGIFKKLDIKASSTVREFRLSADEVAKFQVGQVLRPSEHFAAGQKVDVMGLSKGRGFQGVMRRWNFKGSKQATHGTHEYQRHGGAIGTNMTPGRTLPNLKMPGQWGNEQITTLNLKVARVLEDDVVLITGAVPGSRNGVVVVRGAIQTRRAAAPKS